MGLHQIAARCWAQPSTPARLVTSGTRPGNGGQQAQAFLRLLRYRLYQFAGRISQSVIRRFRRGKRRHTPSAIPPCGLR